MSVRRSNDDVHGLLYRPPVRKAVFRRAGARQAATPWLKAHVMAADDTSLFAFVLGVAAVAVGSVSVAVNRFPEDSGDIDLLTIPLEFSGGWRAALKRSRGAGQSDHAGSNIRSILPERARPRLVHILPGGYPDRVWSLRRDLSHHPAMDAARYRPGAHGWRAGGAGRPDAGRRAGRCGTVRACHCRLCSRGHLPERACDRSAGRPSRWSWARVSCMPPPAACWGRSSRRSA